MAHFELTLEDYRRLNHIPTRQNWKSRLAWVVSLVLLPGSLWLGQYAFAILWALLLLLVYVALYWLRPRIEVSRSTGAFELGPFDIELRTDSYTVRAGDSELKLSLGELWRTHDFGEYYRLDHKSGCLVCLPKQSLTPDETRMVESYRQRFPGFPEKPMP